jgi:hypothetical protein
MVFTQLVENITDLFSGKTNNKHNKRNSIPLNQLAQGLTYLQNKQTKFNELSNNSLLLEQFDTSKLDETTQNELVILDKLKAQYNQKLSQYSNSYKEFMESYYKFLQDVKSCKVKCEDKHRPGSSSSWNFSKIACQTGCDLKAPYIYKCKDNYSGDRVNGYKCNKMTQGKCNNGNVVLGMSSEVTNINYADNQDVTLKDGCCACGGGIGGPPSSEINSIKINKCEDVPNALGFSAGKGTYSINNCYQANVASAHKSRNLWQSYENLTKQNEDLIKMAQNIFNKIKKLKTEDKNINAKIKDEERNLKNQMSLYENVYANIKSFDKTKLLTIEGQVEDELLKEGSQSLQLWIWLSLAILTFSLVLHRMKK